MGFIGSNFVIDWLAHHDEAVVNLDKLTYAGNLASLAGDARHHFVRGDIGDSALVARLLAELKIRVTICPPPAKQAGTPTPAMCWSRPGATVRC